jgi:hypothetical protein
MKPRDHGREDYSSSGNDVGDQFDNALSAHAMNATPADRMYSNTKHYREMWHPTLGQMADRIQEKARTDASRVTGDLSAGYQSYLHALNGGNGNGDGGSGAGDEYEYDGPGGGGGGDGDMDEDGDDGGEEDAHIAAGAESTGRWTRNEHELFLQALKKYGKVRTGSTFSKARAYCTIV